MTNRRKQAFATVVALAAALGAGSALAMAQGNQSMYGPNPSAQSATTQDSDEASPPQAIDSSSAMTPQANASDEGENGYATDEAAGSDNSDNSPVDSDESGIDSDTVTTAPAPVYESVPAYIAPPDSPRYTPETGDAEYGSKLNPVGPQSNRFNDATGQ